MISPLLQPQRVDASPFSAAKPGELVTFDVYNRVRPESESKIITALQWNIERAYKLDAIIALITSNPDFLNADIIAIQEIDVGCERSNWRDSALELARALGMRCLFVAEFEELHSEKLRTPRNQGGGVHGNAIFTWWDVEWCHVIQHSQEFDWPANGDQLGEPRRGGRYALAASLKHPHRSDRVLAYSVHLEVFCGIFGRLRQFSSVLEHSHRHLTSHPHQLILGDLNTMAHGLARFFKKYCCDAMRWRSLGWSEAQWWQKNLWQVTPELAGEGGVNLLLAAHHHSRRPRDHKRESIVDELIEEECQEELESEMQDKAGTGNQIFTQKQLKALVNPHFYCPFSPRTDMTLEVRGFAGKLDWMLVRGFLVVQKGFANDKYDCSDHKLLWLKLDPVEAADPGPIAFEAQNYHQRRRLLSLPSLQTHSRNIVIVSAVVVGFACAFLLLQNKRST